MATASLTLKLVSPVRWQSVDALQGTVTPSLIPRIEGGGDQGDNPQGYSASNTARAG